MSEEFLLGKDAKLYFGASGATYSAMTEIANVRDLTLDLSAGEADVTTRGNFGWKATAATLRECTATFDMLWKPSDPAFAAIRNAFLNSTKIALAVLSDDRATTGAEGPEGDFSITQFSRNEPMAEGVTVSVTAKLATFRQWVEV